jgi:hypothetical protein
VKHSVPRAVVIGAVLVIILSSFPTASATEVSDSEGLKSTVEVRQAGGFDQSTLSLIDDAVRAVRGNSTLLHRVTLRMLRVSRGAEVIQEAPRGFGYPMLTMAVEPASPAVPSAFRSTLSRGEALMGEVAARIRGARAGDVIDLESLQGRSVSVRIGAVVPDHELRWSEILLGVGAVPGLDFDRPYAVLAWGAPGPRIAAAVGIWTSEPGVRIVGGLADRATDSVLPTALVKERFGEFAVAAAEGDALRIDPEWRDTWIVTADLPLVGQTRCHRMVLPYLRSALEEIERSGFAAELDRADFQAAGGCYNPRLNRGADPGYSLSRHSWGIAIDLNPSTNPYAGVPTLPTGVVDVFRRWGFAWGGGWAVPDGMHMEWSGLPSVSAAVCADPEPLSTRPEALWVGGRGALGLWTLLPTEGTCP